MTPASENRFAIFDCDVDRRKPEVLFHSQNLIRASVECILSLGRPGKYKILRFLTIDGSRTVD